MKYNCNKMREFASAIMQKNGLSKQKSDLFAESLIAADMRRISSHGVTRLKTYAYRLEAGLVDAHAETTIIKENSSIGPDGCKQWTGSSSSNGCNETMC